jgi:hypothetical protein
MGSAEQSERLAHTFRSLGRDLWNKAIKETWNPAYGREMVAIEVAAVGVNDG